MNRFEFTCLSDPRLAALALSPVPAWLWSPDARRLLWANATGAAIFQSDLSASAQFDPGHHAAAQIARLAGVLAPEGRPRLERLRGFGAGFGGLLMCQCSRITIGGTDAILVVSTERAGPDLPFNERVRRLSEEIGDGAVFSADGELLQASDSARDRLGGANDLMTLGAQVLAAQASRDGHAEGNSANGAIMIDRLGAGNTMALLVRFAPASAKAEPIKAAPPTATPDATSQPLTSPVRVDSPAPPRPAPAGKRQPLRFLWLVDAKGRFTIESDEFIALIGARHAAALGRPWQEIATELAVDPHGQMSAALETENTFSGIRTQWPVGDMQLPVEMSGLPIFDAERNFQGFRGFGVCRDGDKLAVLATRRVPPVVKEAPVEPTRVVSFPAAPATPEPPPPAALPTEPEAPMLSAREHSAFSEIARELTDRLRNTDSRRQTDDFGPEQHEPITGTGIATPAPPPARIAANGNGKATASPRDAQGERPILDRLPIGLLIYRLNDLIYANKAFLEWTGYSTLQALNEAGGLDSLFIESVPDPTGAKNGAKNGGKTLTISTQAGQQIPVEGRLFSITWNGDNALVLMLNTLVGAGTKTAELNARRVETENRELHAVLDTATDGVLLLDKSGRVLSANRSAEALFGLEQGDFQMVMFGDLFAPESKRPVLDYLERVSRGGAAALINEGREVVGRVRNGGLIPLHMTIGQVGEVGEKFCAVLRDITAWKKTEEELTGAKRRAEVASAAKSDFLAKISHEIRTPLNAIIGFSEVMTEERFGPIGNERYRQYLKDIHASGGHLVSLLNDLLDLSKIEAGKLDLTFTSINLNDVTQQCVAIMQQQANRERIIVRTSLAPALPPVVADARSVRQIVLNLLSNSIKFTAAGGQVIVSTAVTDDKEVVLRVRDTGAGMSEQELRAALEPFRQLATSPRWGASGTGLGLPITKALAEANHASFRITSVVRDGTLVEVAFPGTRVLA